MSESNRSIAERIGGAEPNISPEEIILLYPMKTREQIIARIDDLDHTIDSGLDSSAEDVMKQYLNLKVFHAMKVALEWVLKGGE